MTELYQRMRETLLSSMDDTLIVNHQFGEAVTLIGKLEAENKQLRTALEAIVIQHGRLLGNGVIINDVLQTAMEVLRND